MGTLISTLFRSMCYPFLIILLSSRTNLSVETIGILIGIGAFFSTVGSFVGGTLSDRFGRGNLMLISLLFSITEYVGFAVFSNTYVVASLLIIGGFFGSFFDPVSRALTADLTSSEHRPRAHSFRYIAANAGYGIGPLLGLWLGVIGGILPFVVLSGVFTVYLLLLSWLFYRYKGELLLTHSALTTKVETKKSFSFKATLSILKNDYAILLMVLGGILTTTIEGLWTVPMSAYLSETYSNGAAILAMLLTVNAVTVVLAQTLFVKFTERKNPLHLLVLGCLLFVAAEIGFSIAYTSFSFVVVMVVFTLGEVLILPSQFALLDKISPPDMIGTYYGAFALNGFGNFVGPWLSTLILGIWGGQIMFYAFAVIALFSIVFYISGAKSRGKISSSMKTVVGR